MMPTKHRKQINMNEENKLNSTPAVDDRPASCCCPDIVPLDDYWITSIPDDNYQLETSLIKGNQSTPDSIAGGHWTWRKVAMGYRGEVTGVLLSLDWSEALELQG